jgi:hypothetical protein
MRIPAQEDPPMLRKMIAVIVAAAALGGAAPADAAASRGHWRGARFHGAAVYYPDTSGAPLFADGAIYCWHWFRTGRGWGRAWAC